MRDPERIKPMLELIELAWKEKPDLRLCQLLAVAANRAGWSHDDLFHLEDDKLKKGLNKMAQETE